MTRITTDANWQTGLGQRGRRLRSSRVLTRAVARVLRGREQATTTVELALIVPIFLMLIIGALDFGRAVVLHNVTSEAAREGARQGQVLVTWDEAAAGSITTASTLTAVDEAARYRAGGFGSDPTFTVTSTTGMDSGATEGAYVRVDVSTQYVPVAGTFLKMGSFTVRAKSKLYLP